MILSFESSSVVGKSRMGNNLSTLERFAREVLVAAGADHDDAKALAEILLWADRVGRTGQGVQRLPILCERLTKKLINSPARFVWSTNGGAAAHLDAAEGLGHLAARQAALRAIALARENGIGAVTVSNSNYFGSAGYFAWLIAQAGMLGIVASNSFLSQSRSLRWAQGCAGNQPPCLCGTDRGSPSAASGHGHSRRGRLRNQTASCCEFAVGPRYGRRCCGSPTVGCGQV